MKKLLTFFILGIFLITLASATTKFYDGQYGAAGGYGYIYYYNASSNSFTYRYDEDNYDLFDDDFGVGDAVYWQFWGGSFEGYGQYFNITTSIQADSYELVWQCMKGGVWGNMTKVGDDTEMFSREGYYQIGYGGVCENGDGGVGIPFNSWTRFIRVLVVEVTNPTEGGHIGSGIGDYAMTMPSASIHIIGSENWASIISDDMANDRILVNNRSVSDGTHNTSLQVQSPSGIDLPLSFITEESPSVSYLNITCEMASKILRTYELTFSGNETQTDEIDCYKIKNFTTKDIGRITIKQDRFGCIGQIADTTTINLNRNLFYSSNCQIIIGDGSTSSSFSINDDAWFIRDEVQPAYYSHNPNSGGGVATQIIVTDKATFNSGSKDGTTGHGINGGLIIQSTITGWGPALQSMSGSIINLYNHVHFGNLGGTGGLEISFGSTATVTDSFFSEGKRFNIRGAVIWLRSYVGSWADRFSIWYANDCDDMDGLVLTGTSRSYLKEESNQNVCYKNSFAYQAKALGTNHNITLIDTEVQDYDTTTTSGVNDRKTFQVTVNDYTGNPIAGATIRLYDTNGNMADGLNAFPITTGLNGTINSPVLWKRDFNDILTAYSNFTLSINADGYCSETVEGIPLDEKTLMTITLNPKGGSNNHCVDELGDEYR